MFKKRRSVVVICAIVSLLILAYLYQVSLGVMTRRVLSERSQLHSIDAAKVLRMDWSEHIDAIGTLVANQGIMLTPEVSGVVKNINFRSGSRVKKGDLLVALDDTQSKAALDAAVANRDLALITCTRTKTLYDKAAVSKDKVDHAEAAFKSAQADVRIRQDAYNQKHIRAPFSGRLGIRQISIGQYVSPSVPLVSLQALDPIYVDFSVAEDAAATLPTGRTISVTTDALPGRTFSGSILARESRSDPSTHMVLFRAAIENKDEALFPGLFCRISAETGGVGARLVVPKPAITYAPYGATVYVLKPDEAYVRKPSEGQIKGPIYKVQQVFVKLGEERGNLVVVTSGLEEGDLVVTAGQVKVKNNSNVYVSHDADALADASPQLADR